MLLLLATALVLSIVSHSASADRGLARQLARSGRNVEALSLFEQIVAHESHRPRSTALDRQAPLRIGRTEEAETGSAQSSPEHPSDIDARMGLGAARRTPAIVGFLVLRGCVQ
jgi:hypothetical protein